MFAHTSFYSALFWTSGVGAAFKRIECSTRIGGTIIVLDMRQSLSPTDTKDRRGPRVSTIRLSSARPGEKNRSRHTWSILLSKLSSALFYTLFGVMGTDSVLACGITYRLAVAHTFLKPPRKNGDQYDVMIT